MGHCQLFHAFNAGRMYTYHHQCLWFWLVRNFILIYFL